MPTITGLGYGLIGGVAYGLAGYFNAAKTIGDFKLKPFLYLVCTSGVVGAIAGFNGTDFGLVANSSMAVGISVFVKKIIDKLWTYFKK